MSNRIHLNGFATSYSFAAVTGDTIISSFDDITAADGTSGAGTFIYATSTSPGNFEVTGAQTFSTGASVNEFSTDGTLADNSDTAVPTEQAVKTYVDNGLEAIVTPLGETDHGNLDGLADDDHTQYIKVDGSRDFAGSQSVADNMLTNHPTLK